MKTTNHLICLLSALCTLAATAAGGERWPAQKAQEWYDSIPWPVGANFVPSTAINQLEMWQEDTFDPETVDRELGWAKSLGMNTMRVFLHNIPWQEDAEGFCTRIDRYLEIANQHGIRTMFVLFDSVWNPYPKPGKQPAPRPHVHNSGWVQSPGRNILEDPARHDELKPYVTAILTRYKDDRRVLCWDLFNEPDNCDVEKFGPDSFAPDLSPELKLKRAAELLEKVFAWAREADPSQPLTAGVWGNPVWLEKPDRVDAICLARSDLISFHTYDGPAAAEKMIAGLKKLGRPILCTEYMARVNNSTFQGILPIFKKHRIAAYNWGLVSGKTQTIYPWDSWRKKYTAEPDPWFHDIFRRDGTPYSQDEVNLIRRLTGKTEPIREALVPVVE